MARMKPDVREAFLTLPIIGVLATLRRDGRAFQTPVWFLWRDGSFWLTGTYTRAWCKQIFREPRVALCIEATQPVTRYVAVDCLATPVEPKDVDIWPVTTALAEKYVGARGGDVAAFVANMQTEPRLLLRLEPTEWRAIDLSVYHGSKGDLAYQQRTAGQ